jgi:uncharacterized membrane protein YfhO
MEEIGLVKKGNEIQSRWVTGLIERPLLQTWASSKYILIRGDARHLKAFEYDSITQIGDVKVFRNNFFLPLGFVYDSYISAADFSKLSSLKKDITLLRAFVAEDTDIPSLQGFNRFDLADTLADYGFIDYFKDVNARKSDTLLINRLTQNRLKGTITVDSTRMLFLSIPYDKGWHAKLNGKEVALHICNFGFIGIPLTPGSYTIELDFRPPFYTLSLWGTFSGVLIFLTMIAIPYLKKKKAIKGNHQDSHVETNEVKSGA